MSEHQGLPVAGYRPQSTEALALVNRFKEAEERILREIDQLRLPGPVSADGRWLAMARTHIEQGFMALNRAVFQPERVRLPEDRRGDPPRGP